MSKITLNDEFQIGYTRHQVPLSELMAFAPSESTTLSANSSISDAAIITKNKPSWMKADCWIAVDVGTVECEIRKVSAIDAAGNVSLNAALSYAHSEDDPVLFIYQPIVSVAWFGAAGDWNGSTGTDDTTAIQRAIDQAKALDMPAEVRLTGKHRITSTLSWNLFVCRLVGTGRTQIYYDASSGVALDLDGNGQYPLDALVNIDLRSNSRSGSSVGLRLNNGGTYMTHAAFRNVNIEQFAIGVQFASNCWGNVFDNVRIHECATGLYWPSGISQSGERVEFTNTMVSQCDLAFDVQASSININMQNCSVDYNEQIASIIGTITFDQCHLEFSGTNATHPATDHQFILNDENSFINFNQCRITLLEVMTEVFKPYQARYSNDLFSFVNCKFYVTFNASYASARSNPYHRLVLDYIDPEQRPRAIFTNCRRTGQLTYPLWGQSRVVSGASLTNNDNLPEVKGAPDEPATFSRTSTVGTGSTSGGSDVLSTVTFSFGGSYGSEPLRIYLPVGPGDYGKSVLTEMVLNCNQAKTVTFQYKFYKRRKGTYRIRSTFNSTTGQVISLPISVLSSKAYSFAITPVANSATIGTIYVTPGTSTITVYNTGADASTAFELELFYLDEAADQKLFQASTTQNANLSASTDTLITLTNVSQNTVPVGCDYVMIEISLSVDASTVLTITHPQVVLI